MKQTETLIVGQGLAGTCLALQMLESKKPFLVMDAPHLSRSSIVAAGIMNPLVFRYLTLSWRANIYLPEAMAYYRKTEQLLGVRLLYPSDMLRFIPATDKKLYLESELRPGIDAYLRPIVIHDLTQKEGFIPGQFIQVHQAAWVDLKTLINRTKELLAEQKLLINEKFDVQWLKHSDSRLDYQGMKFDRLVLCEGYQARINPMFDFVPFRPVKGEILIVSIPGLGLKQILNSSIFLLPLGNDIFKLGATYDWDDLTELPTNKAREFLIAGLRKLVHLPFEVLDHLAGVRPSVADRRPVVGCHPSCAKLWIMNGLGAKGAIMAPSLSHYLMERMFKQCPPDQELEPLRFIDECDADQD